jgi:SAM-dependent methyltransferase
MSSSDAIAVALDKPQRHGGTIHSQEPLTVESPSQQWAYAISMSLLPALKTAMLPFPIKVSTKVAVQSGELQCLLTANDFTTLLGELSPVTGAGTHLIELFIERETAAPQLVFRNAGRGDQPCVFTVEAISISPDQGDSLKWSVGLSDVMAGAPARIDIKRLHHAVINRHRLLADDVEVFDRLRRKWKTVPAGLSDRRATTDLLTLPDKQLREIWVQTHQQTTTGDDGFSVRGWYQLLYRDILRGRKVLEIGSGFGIDGIEFARHGAQMTFVDIVQENLEVMKRLCSIFGIDHASFVFLHGLSSLDSLAHDYDIVWCQGSQINVPFEFAKRECAAILPHLKPGGRWIELAYPRERWVREGSPPFRIWGNMTDGEGTPWMEWYDLEKVLNRLAPVRFRPALAFNFHDNDFNWFDLVRAEA